MTNDPGEFWNRGHDWLESDPVRNSVLLTNLRSRRDGTVVDDGPAAWVAVYDDHDEQVGAAMRTPPANIFLSELPSDAIEPLVETMLRHCPDAPGVVGTVDQADTFARSWSTRTGSELRTGMRQRIHRLDEVVLPTRPVSGVARLARLDDRELLIEWSEAFVAEAEHQQANGDVAPGVDVRLAEDRAYVWDDDGPVSYVGISQNLAGVVRVGPVYTPPAERGKGYASWLVAACSQGALDAGARQCSLYTDLANPTSNKIYAAVGYVPVGDVAVFRFG